MSTTALGFRTHSGWALLVAVANPGRAPEAVARLRLEMVDSSSPGGAQPFHKAAELELNAAEALVNSAAGSANRIATVALRKFTAELSQRGMRAVGAIVLAGSGRTISDLRVLLGSHPAIHTAEGELFRNAVLHACHECGISASRIREKELLQIAAAQLTLTEQQITKQLMEMGRKLGRPWTQDEKLAALAAWLSLSSR
jgi:hypothetical protein